MSRFSVHRTQEEKPCESCHQRRCEYCAHTDNPYYLCRPCLLLGLQDILEKPVFKPENYKKPTGKGKRVATRPRLPS